MKILIAGWLSAMTVLAGCGSALQPLEADCHLKATVHGVCGTWAPRVPGSSTGSTAQVRPLTHREELRRH